MRIASPFQRRTGPRPRARGRGWACALLVSAASGCFFELAELAPLGAGGTSGAGGDGLGGDGGSPIGDDAAVAGTAGTANVDPTCPLNQKNCGNGCVPISVENGCGSPSCTPCAPLAQASLRCNTDSGACEFAECDPGFADCNGDTSTYTGQVGSDGCEYGFGPNGELRPTPATLDVPQVPNIDVADGERGDWTGIPAYPLLATCDDCVDNSLPAVAVPNVVPPRSDLDAYFRVAWDEAFFYVLADVYDTAVVSDGSQREGNCQGAAASLCEDSLTLLVDGHNNRSSQLGNDDLYLFLGVGGGDPFRVAQTPVNVQRDMQLKATPHGLACYRIEARLSWAYVTATGPGQPIDEQFAPVEGKQYGFDVAVNDWDPGISDPEPQRESQLFWISPGNGFQQDTTNFGSMTLRGSISSAPSGPK